MSEDLSETALMMIKSLDLLVVHTANVYDDVARIENSRISGPLQACGCLGRER